MDLDTFLTSRLSLQVNTRLGFSAIVQHNSTLDRCDIHGGVSAPSHSDDAISAFRPRCWLLVGGSGESASVTTLSLISLSL